MLKVVVVVMLKSKNLKVYLTLWDKSQNIENSQKCSGTLGVSSTCTGARTETGLWVRHETISVKCKSDMSSKNSLPGSVIGNMKKGVFLRSQDPDRSSFIQECPCQVCLLLSYTE